MGATMRYWLRKGYLRFSPLHERRPPRHGAKLSKRERGPQGKAGQMTISDENRARFEGLGTAEVRHELGVGYVRHLSGEQRVQAQDWLAEQDASFKDATMEARRRETLQFILGIIVGALGALGIVAAWLVIKVWLR